MNRKRIAAVGGIAAAVCLVVGAGIFFWMRSERSSDKAEVYVSTVSSLTETASGAENRYAGVVEPQKTVKIKLESKRKVKEQAAIAALNAHLGKKKENENRVIQF